MQNTKSLKIPKDMLKGMNHETNSCGSLEIIKYISANNVVVMFKSTLTIKRTDSQQIRSGKVKDHMHPTVCGVGFIGDGKYTAKTSKLAYTVWNGVIQRCYSDKLHLKCPTYSECETNKDWNNFQIFAKWHEENYPNDGKSYQLDKDLLCVGNKIYSAGTCLFIPAWLNSFTIDCGSSRGNLPIGVSFDKQTSLFRAKCSSDGKTISLGRFATSDDAHLAWEKCKLNLALDKKSEMDAIDKRIYPNVVQIIKSAK